VDRSAGHAGIRRAGRSLKWAGVQAFKVSGRGFETGDVARRLHGIVSRPGRKAVEAGSKSVGSVFEVGAEWSGSWEVAFEVFTAWLSRRRFPGGTQRWGRVLGAGGGDGHSEQGWGRRVRGNTTASVVVADAGVNRMRRAQHLIVAMLVQTPKRQRAKKGNWNCLRSSMRFNDACEIRVARMTQKTYLHASVFCLDVSKA
jgi:hypothetical protein